MADVPRIEGTTLKSRFLITSVGCSSVDEILGGGLPVAGIFIIDECCSRTYASVLERYFLAEGASHGQSLFFASPEIPSPDIFSRLPAKVASSNESEKDGRQAHFKADPESLKIAWRYSTMPKFGSAESSSAKAQFDLSKTMEKSEFERCDLTTFPSASDVDDFGEPYPTYGKLWYHLFNRLGTPKHSTSNSAEQKKILRVVVEDIGSPLWADTRKVQAFMAYLRAIVSDSLGVCMLTMNSNGMDDELREKIYSYGDAVFRLNALDKDTSVAVIGERFDGYFRIIKLPTLTSIASPSPASTDLVFELHRKCFEVRVFHLPPVLGDDKTKMESKTACNVAVEF